MVMHLPTVVFEADEMRAKGYINERRGEGLSAKIYAMLA